MKKKILTLIVSSVMMISLVACVGKVTTNDSDSNVQSSNNEQSTVQSTENNDSDENDENTVESNDVQSSEKLVITDGSKLGVLQPVAEQTDFVINGLYISSESGQHEYESIENISTLGTDGLNSEFELNEWIGFYVDTDSNSPMNIYFVKNDAEMDYDKITVQELESICSDKGYPVISDAIPDVEYHGSVGQTYVNPESSQPDLFNVFFTANGKVCYMVQLNMIAEDSTK